MKHYFLNLLILISVSILIEATPSCERGVVGSQLICSASDIDFDLKSGLVSDHGDVKSISLKACKVANIQCDAFQGLPSLQSLDLAQNKLKTLEPCVFEHLSGLTSLNLTNNKIPELSIGVFDNILNLEDLHLEGNKIKRINPSLFQKLVALKTLDLSNNGLEGKDIDTRIFENNKQLTSLNLSRNDMSTASEDMLEELEMLQFLYLDRCFLTTVPSFATKVNIKSLKELVLSTNRIRNLDNASTFINIDNLELLNFNHNAIESISENIFSPLIKLKSVVLRHNKLKEVPDTLFQNMPKLVNIDLSYNLIEYIKVSTFRNTPMKNLNLSGNKLTYLPENFYGSLINAGGKLKKFYFSDNPWKCSCLVDLLAELNANKVEYNTVKFNGKESVCFVGDDPYIYICKRE